MHSFDFSSQFETLVSKRGELESARENLLEVKKQLNNTPRRQAFIVNGVLDGIRYRGGYFRLLVGRNSWLLGRLNHDFLDIETLRSLWGRRVTIEGMVRFKPDGRPRLIEARRMRKSIEGDGIFGEMPMTAERVQAETLERARSTDLSKLIGSWPGDEPIEKLIAMLD